LFIANDYGVVNSILNQGGKKFIEKGEDLLIGLTPKSGMNVSFGDVLNSGKPGIYVSNITEEGILLQGIISGFLLEESMICCMQTSPGQCGIEYGGWSYGAQFGDLNNDGNVDLTWQTGFISGKEGTSYWYDYSKGDRRQ